MEGSRKRLQEESTCSICLEDFTDPVLLDCGHNFCRSCIMKYWGASPRVATCPQCREMVQEKRLKQLTDVVLVTKEPNEIMKDCVVMSEEKTAHECKGQISNSLEILRKEKEDILLYKAENEKESQYLLEEMETEREKTRAVFRDLSQFLEEQEKHLLVQIDQVESEIMRRRDEHQTSLSGKLSSINNLIQGLEEKQQSQANGLLQNMWNVLERCSIEPFKIPVAFPVGLKWKIHDCCDINTFLEVIMKKFQESLLFGLPLRKAEVMLDPDTAHRKLILSEDCRSVRWVEKAQNLPDSPERFESYYFVLGQEGFTTGRHCWEVTVEGEGEWTVGIASKSVKRDGEFDCNSEEGIWEMGKWERECSISNPPDCSLASSQELRKIRVTLNCGGGRLTFFNADTGAKICAYEDAPLSGKTLLPLFCVQGNVQLTLIS